MTCSNVVFNFVLFFSKIQIFDLWEQIFPKNAPPLVSAQANVRSTQISSTAVGDYATITEKTSLKNCVVGPNCTVNMKTRIFNSVLTSGVVIEEGYTFNILIFLKIHNVSIFINE